ncbi:MAG TPA: VOC family protein [Armatimonadota bacterium]|jgi:uncharacterized glyoxalase superfamily protein PhnB
MSEVQTTITPHLTCRGAAQAVEFYKKAFGAEAEVVRPLPDGRIIHAALNIGGAPFYLVDEFPEHGGKGPLTLGGSPVALTLRVADCDAVFNRAVEAGCTVTMPLADTFWGDRYGMVTDPFGHLWGIATTQRQVSEDEIHQAMAGFSEGGREGNE